MYEDVVVAYFIVLSRMLILDTATEEDPESACVIAENSDFSNMKPKCYHDFH
jgi:hypothetical protein